MKYLYHPYHAYFQVRAQQEITFLYRLIPTSQIEHFGSTAIPGVGGKGIIDISVSVLSNKLESTSKIISDLGYEFKESGGVPNERLFFQKTITLPKRRKQTFHLHLSRIGNQNMKDCISFRDFLRKNPQLAQEYSNCKHAAVKAAKMYRNKADKKKAYMDAKKPIIEKIMHLMNSQNNSTQ